MHWPPRTAAQRPKKSAMSHDWLDSCITPVILPEANDYENIWKQEEKPSDAWANRPLWTAIREIPDLVMYSNRMATRVLWCNLSGFLPRPCINKESTWMRRLLLFHSYWSTADFNSSLQGLVRESRGPPFTTFETWTTGCHMVPLSHVFDRATSNFHGPLRHRVVAVKEYISHPRRPRRTATL